MKLLTYEIDCGNGRRETGYSIKYTAKERKAIIDAAITSGANRSQVEASIGDYENSVSDFYVTSILHKKTPAKIDDDFRRASEAYKKFCIEYRKFDSRHITMIMLIYWKKTGKRLNAAAMLRAILELEKVFNVDIGKAKKDSKYDLRVIMPEIQHWWLDLTGDWARKTANRKVVGQRSKVEPTEFGNFAKALLPKKSYISVESLYDFTLPKP